MWSTVSKAALISRTTTKTIRLESISATMSDCILIRRLQWISEIIIIIIIIISICIAPFVRGYNALLPIIAVSGKSSQSFRLPKLLRVLLAKCPPYQHLDCNISHDQHRVDALRSTKQLRLNILPKDTHTRWH